MPAENLSADNVLVGIVMGSQSDWPVMRCAAQMLARFGVRCEQKVVSAHRTPELMYQYAQSAESRGLQCIIAGAGGAAHLPGMIASLTTLPVLGVPIPTAHLKGQDSLLSIVQMPKGVPVATFAIGEAGATNAAIFACRMLSTHSQSLQKALEDFGQEQQQAVHNSTLEL